MTAIRKLAGLVLGMVALTSVTADVAGEPAAAPAAGFDSETALEASRAAIGRELADYRFTDPYGKPVRISDFSGRPILINLIYTSCSYYCPLTTQTLARAVGAAQKALGEDSFAVLTIGFDSHNDNPVRMRSYARAQGIDLKNWHFVAADAETIVALTGQLGFIFRPAAHGYDHLAQTTLVDSVGRVARQIYGTEPSVPQVVEPLKRLLAGDAAGLASIDDIVERIRLFCTLYDPDRDAYSFDWSFFIGLGIGLLSITLLAGFLASQLLLYLRARP